MPRHVRSRHVRSRHARPRRATPTSHSYHRKLSCASYRPKRSARNVIWRITLTKSLSWSWILWICFNEYRPMRLNKRCGQDASPVRPNETSP